MKTTENKPDSIESNTKTPSKIGVFLKKHKYYVLLIVLLMSSIIWHYASMALLRNSFTTEKASIESTYKLKLDSLNSNRLQLTAKTFSWAIRSELLRENTDQVNQFFNDFIKNESIEKLQFIDSETNTITISTDKKDEGLVDSKFTNTINQEVIKDSTYFQLVTPITGLNKRIGVFVMKVKKLDNK
ncbi:hypothetical protein [Mariniflexile sp. AS56]|uniref:hypothetical protein n=1 Tax=Mariniflexile sp. AS56 TaxID=3063957 RepID=UPI0026EBD3BF|nr:hypothetical protein [Mariniflexile sp. AS56]MDO7170674.1 hypothetical protein [Mariniflexile sp. AS56]